MYQKGSHLLILKCYPENSSKKEREREREGEREGGKEREREKEGEREGGERERRKKNLMYQLKGDIGHQFVSCANPSKSLNVYLEDLLTFYAD